MGRSARSSPHAAWGWKASQRIGVQNNNPFIFIKLHLFLQKIPGSFGENSVPGEKEWTGKQRVLGIVAL
ncbi:hypothetical protein B4135_1833 [Caldibacillus debilis]|uniref:Uncharacterized protein n=1 Tax=Caldibacillus debilis TaxID=301148 RepID=A0A150M8I6_9BACI|nr:hypothetical protein B4135_1833 [Caldibacillus debilis]